MTTNGNSANGQNNGAKKDPVLVVVQLSGGNDFMNTLIPYTAGMYYDNRPLVGIPEDQSLPINDTLAFHPDAAPLKGMFEDGKVAIVQGIGYPNASRSHFRRQLVSLLDVDLDSVASEVRDVHPALVVEPYRRRPTHPLLLLRVRHLAVSQHGRIRPDVGLAALGKRGVADELVDVLARRVEQLDPVVAAVHNVDIAVVVDLDTGRAMELAVARTGRAELHDELTVRSEFLHAVVVPVGDQDVALAVRGKIGRASCRERV